MLAALREAGRFVFRVRVPVTVLEGGPDEGKIRREVLAALAARHPDVDLHFAPEREQGRGYYVVVCFHVYAQDSGGEAYQLADGGLTTWTQQLTSDDKERLFISGFGTERVLGFG